jgi:predicted transcriptional regulator of viral defense system
MNKKDSDKQIKKASLAGHGYVRRSTLDKYRIQARALKTLVAEGTAHKVKPGLYKLTSSGATAGAWGDFVDVCTAMPSAVICLYSALSYYDLTTFNPPQVAIALPRNVTPARMSFPPVKAFRFSERFYSPGIERVRAGVGNFRIYSPEKTICDCFRLRRSMGEDLALEALKTYVHSRRFDSARLHEMAAVCSVTSVIQPYLRALLAE